MSITFFSEGPHDMDTPRRSCPRSFGFCSVFGSPADHVGMHMKHLLASCTEVVRRSRGRKVVKMLHGLSCEVSSQDHAM